MRLNLPKNTYAAIVALFIAMFILPQHTQAQTTYDLKIAGTQVTDANCDNLSSISGVSGTVKYYPKTKTLTLSNATIKTSGEVYGIDSKIDGLTILLWGPNTITASDFSAICIHESQCTIGDMGTLKLDGKYFGLYAMRNAKVTIEDCTIESDCAFGTNNDDAEITIRRATITAKGKDIYKAMCGIQKLTLEGCKIVQPAGAKYDPSLHGIALNGKLTEEKVIIESDTYLLTIANQKVTKDNCDNLSVIPDVSGTVKYDGKTKTLILQDATIDTQADNAINSHIEGLTIKVIGTSKLIGKEATLMFRLPTTITGGTLNVESRKECAISSNFTNLTIDNCTVNAKGKQYGIAGWLGTNDEKLFIKNADVTAEGTGYASICYFSTLTMEGCAITQPIGAKFDPVKLAVVLNGETVKGKVVITRNSTAIGTPDVATDATTTKQGIYTLSGVRQSGNVNDLPKGVYIVNGKKVIKK